MNNNLSCSILGRSRKELQTTLPASVSRISTALEYLKQKAPSTTGMAQLSYYSASIIHTNLITVSDTNTGSPRVFV